MVHQKGQKCLYYTHAKVLWACDNSTYVDKNDASLNKLATSGTTDRNRILFYSTSNRWNYNNGLVAKE